MNIADDIKDRPLVPGMIYRVNRIFDSFIAEKCAESVDYIEWEARLAFAQLVGPKAERIRIPIGADRMCLILTAQIAILAPFASETDAEEGKGG